MEWVTSLEEKISSMSLEEKILTENDETMEVDEMHTLPDWMSRLEICKSQITINEKPKPNFRALASKPNVKSIYNERLPRHIEAAFFTGNIDEDDKNFWITSSPKAVRTAKLRSFQPRLTDTLKKKSCKKNLNFDI